MPARWCVPVELEALPRVRQYGVDDARLVVLNARDAADRGAAIRTRTEVMSARRDNGSWQVELRPASGEPAYTVTARLVVNAAGPWADRVLHRLSGANAAGKVRLVQGSHIVVRKVFDDPRCFTFQNTDGRIVFAIPYEDDYTLIGHMLIIASGDVTVAEGVSATND